ncbi:hypothetical protein A2U01_0067340, partial [Trifolium medium]|nr:hypothetical protein [Trifolium medium]
MDISPNNESSSMKLDLVLLGLSLFPMISSFGCEDLYLNVFLGSIFSSELISDSGSGDALVSDLSVFAGSETSIGSEMLMGSEASSS